ncbi:MAG: hypothetical protein GY803_27210 [Chloroflexi bacterium]|nr:hypothetical protein [Chloroflexota bacterium]
MTKTVFINGQEINLDPAQLIQSGGEGMVFGLGNGAGATAVKLYHQPTNQRAAKLRHLIENGLAARLPDGILGPSALAADGDGRIIGFQMPRLPAGSLPIKKLSHPRFWQKNKPAIADILALFHQIHAALTRLHQLGVVIGDFNDHNIFFSPAHLRMRSQIKFDKETHPQRLDRYPKSKVKNGQALSNRRLPTHTPAHLPTRSPAFIDVDSYQFGSFPCPVAMQAFLDPTLYQVTDFGKRPYFTPETDWYAFAVLLVKSLLQVHPYGGTHKRHKSLVARAGAKVSVLDTAVTYPQTARPLNALSDDLKRQIHLIFERGQRHPFPIQLIASQHFSRSASQPVSASVLRQSAIPVPHSKTLLAVDGVIEHAAVRGNGRMQAIMREDKSYRLARLGIGGVLDEMTLFDGQPGYRFGSFGRYLAVNPPGKPHLLILDVGGSRPSQVTMIETAFFRETAVFAATSRHLYRIAGTWIMRGSVQNGLYIEDAIATAHRNQTEFWASPVTETLVGRHRIFAENRFFLLHEGANYDISIPQLAPGESLIGIEPIFSANAVALRLNIRHNGQLRSDAYVVNFKGQPIQHAALDLPPANSLPHPNGRILWEPDRLILSTAD